MLAKLVNDSSTPARNRVGDMKQCPEWGMGRRCCRLTRTAAVGSVRRPSPGRTAMGEARRFLPLGFDLF
jgi:hypothetical protein